MHINPVATALASVSCGVPLTVENLTMVPLVARRPSSPVFDYVLLDDALASGAAEITEVSDEGSVPELRFVNRGASPVLVLDGQELLGARHPWHRSQQEC